MVFRKTIQNIGCYDVCFVGRYGPEEGVRVSTGRASYSFHETFQHQFKKEALQNFVCRTSFKESREGI